MMDKTRISDSFAHAASAYDAHAHIQRRVALNLSERITVRWPRHIQRIFEIGCGTGNLTALLAHAFPQASITATDLAPAMLRACQQRIGLRASYAQLDGETASCEGFDLITSSLAFQWFDDQSQCIERLARQGPRLAVATLLDGTFAEWKAAHARLGLQDGVLPFMTEAQLQAVCQTSGLHYEVETLQEVHPRAMDFVRALKGIGAGTPRTGHQPAPLGKVLRQFPDGITISYQVAYILSDRHTA